MILGSFPWLDPPPKPRPPDNVQFTHARDLNLGINNITLVENLDALKVGISSAVETTFYRPCLPLYVAIPDRLFAYVWGCS